MRLIRRAVGVALVRPTAPWRDGMRDVAVLNAANSKATRLGHADEPGRRHGCPSIHGSSFWTRSTEASRSGRCYVILALPQTRCSVSPGRRGVVQGA
jgi:hypothetical protein